jgi:ABC-type iron transport system FetAB ATPase subunit
MKTKIRNSYFLISTDSWTDDITRLVLFSGPNGTGKSIILRMIGMLWETSGYWPDQNKNRMTNSRWDFWIKRNVIAKQPESLIPGSSMGFIDRPMFIHASPAGGGDERLRL